MTTRSAVKITDIRCSGLPNVGLPKRPGKYYAKVVIDNKAESTSVSPRGNVARWIDTLYFDNVRDSSSLEIQVYARRTLGSDDHIGSLKDSTSSLLAGGAIQAVTRNLHKYDVNGVVRETSTVIEFTVSTLAPAEDLTKARMDDALSHGKAAFSHMVSAPPLLRDTESVIPPPIDYLNPVVCAWEPLIEKIQLCTQMVDKFSEVHPYTKVAWAVLSIAYKVFLDQKCRDACIGHLVDTMDDACAFVHEAEPLKKVESQKEIITLMMQQVTECGYFIRDYARQRKFWKRTLANVSSLVDNKIEQYEARFRELKSALQEHAVVQTEIVVLRVLDVVENINAEIALGDMPYATGARYDPDKGCLPGTRTEVIDEIINWVNSDADTVPRVFLLIGMAGTGKSAISHTLARLFDDFERLGSSFCFDRAHQAERRPDILFSTIARDLADLDIERKSSLWKLIEGKTALRKTRSPREQFEKFILRPSKDLVSFGPILVVIDALDESGDATSRQALLTILANGTADLPSNFRILVTTRAESDILEAFHGLQHVNSKYLDTNTMSTNIDIRHFVQTQLKDVAGLERKYPGNGWCDLLVQCSEGLFQWASTACRFIKGNGKGGLDPVEQMDILISSTSRTTRLSHLDNLYSEILMRTFETGNATCMRRFRSIMGLVLVVREPLSITSIRKLWAGGDDLGAVDLIIRPLGSLLSGIADESSPIRLLHTSFRDFLTDSDRSGLFYIDASIHHRCLTLLSFRLMNATLQFNLCQLDTSYTHNIELMAHHAHNKDAITPHLSYSCRFYADHLLATIFDREVTDQVREFLQTRLLFWLEFLSLIKGVTIAMKSLSSIVEWSKDDHITAFATDAYKFVSTFRSVISYSAPHIYLSALPFAPKKSLVSQLYLPLYPRVPRVQYGKINDWPPILNVIEGHTHYVNSIALSPNGNHIASGSSDGTIKVWDIETGDLVIGPFDVAEYKWIRSVAYSQDGKRIVSGSTKNDVMVFDAETGDVLSGPFICHSNWIASVSFSHDGKRIVSGSWDKTINVLDAKTGDILKTIDGHTDCVNSVAFSLDDKYIVSGSSDGTIRVWDTETGDCVSGPFEHGRQVWSVKFSPVDKRIISGSSDKTIRVWDSETGDIVSGPFEGHTGAVQAVEFSLDSERVVSGSEDKTIRVWDAKTGRLVAGPFDGHTGPVTSVMFSRDNKYILSGSQDNTIRVWDAENGNTACKPFELPTSWVTFVAFSQDGKRIASKFLTESNHDGNTETEVVASGASDGHASGVDTATSLHESPIVPAPSFSTIMSWDAEAGEVVSLKGPADLVESSRDRFLQVWDVETGNLVSGPFACPTSSSDVFSRDNKRVVTISDKSDNKTMCVWDTMTGNIVSGPLKGHTDYIKSIAVSPDGKRIVSGSNDKTIIVWDADTGEIISGPFEGHEDAIESVAFSPDGTRIVSGSWDNTIRVWDVEKGEVVFGPFEGHTHWVTAAVFSQDGKSIVSGSADNTIKVWDAETGDVLSGPFEGHTDCVCSVAFSPDGKRIVSGSWDLGIRVWNIENSSCNGFRTNSRMENGWIVNEPSELLFWVPSWSRTGLWRPNNVAVICERPTKLDLSDFAHGSSWQQCKAPL